ncbi:MAG: hypothetical protein HN975_02075 [Anaerolineae bacterium]|jgi:hypothetical protein|nr:hypothetical protein [Anaerolineae bacterium]
MEFNQKVELVKQFKGLKKERRLREWKSGFQRVLREEKFLAQDWSLKEQFMMLVEGGRDLLDDINEFRSTSISEAVTSADFSTVNGQIIYSEVMKGYENETLITDQLCTTRPTNFDGEKIAGATSLGDDASVVPENTPIPEVGVSEDWIETPSTDKRALIISISKEAVFFDKTGVLLKNASDVGKAIGISKEKRIMSLVTGITNSYKHRGNAIDTYGANAGTHDWKNLSASTALQDWTDVDAMLQMLMAITDPNTGEPILNTPNQMLIPPALTDTANRIMNAIHVEATSNTNNVTRSPRPNAQYQVLTNQYMKNATSSDSTWFLGNFKEAFSYQENWPMTVTSQMAGSTAEFERDILVRHKASERGVPAVFDPRLVGKATG